MPVSSGLFRSHTNVKIIPGRSLPATSSNMRFRNPSTNRTNGGVPNVKNGSTGSIATWL